MGIVDGEGAPLSEAKSFFSLAIIGGALLCRCSKSHRNS